MKKLQGRTEAVRRGSSHSDFLMLTTLVVAMILATGYCVANHDSPLPTAVAIAER